MEKLSVLVVEDNPADSDLIAEYLGSEGGYELDQCELLQDALKILEDGKPRVILSDLSLPDSRGLDSVRRLLTASPKSPLIVVSGSNDNKVAIEAMKLGAQDYIEKWSVARSSLNRAILHASERKRAELQLLSMANYDQLTGLANRGMFCEQLERSVRRARRSGQNVVVAFIDLDKFKHINDTFGHSAGDQMLCEAARRLKASVRDFDTVARLSGDEFALIMEEIVKVQDADEVANRILRHLCGSIVIGGHDITISASIGLACFPEAAETPDELLQLADRAMYSAKRRGRNCIERFCPSESLSVWQVDAEPQLYEAFRKGKFRLHYQPQFHAKTMREVGAEALLRLDLGTDIIIGPNDFIRVLEKSELMFEVSEWVIREACSKLVVMHETNPHLKVSVNISARHLVRGGLIGVVRRALERYKIPPSSLELEITESILVSDSETARLTLDSLRQMGVKIAIDDFGTGYSSLAYLERFSVDTIKIDRGFVKTIGNSRTGGTIAAAVIGLSHKLGLSVVGEGVETPEQLEFLRSSGCDIVQGFLLGRPSENWVSESQSFPLKIAA